MKPAITLSVLGGKLKLLAVIIVLVAGSIGVAIGAGVVGTPDVVDVENQFVDVNETTTVIESTLHISNPAPVSIEFGGLSAAYIVTMNDIEMAAGAKNGIVIESGESTVDFVTNMDNERIPRWWASHVSAGERTELVINASVHSRWLDRTVSSPQTTRTIETDVISSFNSSEDREINANRPLVQDPVAVVTQTNASWGEVSSEQTPIDMRFDVHNPNSVPFTITEIGYTITMNDIVVGDGASDRTYVIPPGETRSVQTQTAIENARLDSWWVTHLENDEVTEVEIDFYVEVDMSAVGGGTVRVPVDALTYTETIKTEIFDSPNSDAEQ